MKGVYYSGLRIATLVLFLMVNAADAYSQWSKTFLQHGRTGNGVFILDQHKAISVGGNPFNDSLQSIFVSTDRGANWGITQDTWNPWLQSVFFYTDMKGLAVGDDGTILKTVNGASSWAEFVAPGNTFTRHFKSVFFTDSLSGYIVGGWPANDSIQTIIKTTDGGDTWFILLDTFGYQLRSVYFPDSVTGYAVGENGTVLKTTDAGMNWATVNLPGNTSTRDYYGVYFLSADTGFVIGGNLSNDSIQTILKTEDGGANWVILLDVIGPMLRSISFADKDTGYIVGNKGVIYKTTDAGNAWYNLMLPDTINDSTDLYAVSFLDKGFGAATGRFGKVLVYSTAPPPPPVAATVITVSASLVTQSSAQLNGVVNANGSWAEVKFEYGLSTSFGNVVNAVPDTISGLQDVSVTYSLTNLNPNTVYYYRVLGSNEGGPYLGQTKSFYTADCQIPNCDFESWDMLRFDIPVYWKSIGGVSKALSFDGSFAPQLTGNDYDNAGAIILGDIGDNGPVGGYPFNSRPDSIAFFAKHDIAIGDTAFAITVFKANGQNINFQTHPITGSSSGNFIRYSFPISYTAVSIPDTVLLAFVSTNVFTDTAQVPANFLTIDKVSLPGATDTVPNWNFELWTTDSIESPSSWVSVETSNHGNATVDRVSKTTDRASGNFAIRVANDGSSQPSTIATGSQNGYPKPDFPVYYKPTTFNGYWKYYPQNNDTCSLNLTLFANGVLIGNAYVQTDTLISAYSPFESYIYYMDTTSIPDSASVSVRLAYMEAHGLSVLYLDNLSFDGFRPINNPNAIVSVKDILSRLYPNPTSTSIKLAYYSSGSGVAVYSISDLSGKVYFQNTGVVQGGNNQKEFDISEFPDGIYILSTTTTSYTFRKKFVVSR